ncbi:MAG: hypothetical protein D3905_14960 [Candidatus Electrothrix sp. AS4_5]|nr:hypothetical protein [Candidatus Electrothrix gigas]MCI5191056.1 hypothetical protein [Candidatus Electrothrix gigas]
MIYINKTTICSCVVLLLIGLIGCQQGSHKVRKTIPAKYTLSYKQVVYVENDGRCQIGQLIKVTGGKKSRNIARRYECVSPPQWAR